MASYIFFPTNEYSDSTKSQEEIKQLMVEDLGSAQKNMIFLLTKGHVLQKPYVYRNFPQCWREVLPYVLNLLPSETSDNQIIAAESLAELLGKQRPALTADELARIFQTCVKCMYLWNWTVNEKCVRVIEVLLKIDPNRKALVEELEKIVVQLGKANQPIVSKVTAGRIISVIFQDCTRKLKASMMDILKSILAHPESEARRIWLTEIFPKLLKNSELTFIELHLQQKLFEAVYDKNEDIGLCALQAILTHSEYFSQQEKSSRVVKLFVDSIMSKHEKISVMTSKLLGHTYQKLQDVILQNQQICLRFWQTLIELSQSKNPIILNNFVYNLPGILLLSKPRYNIQPISEIYIELFYDNLASKFQLAACFPVMIQIFANKKNEFKEIVYNMFEEVLDEDDECDEGFRVLDIILSNFAVVAKALFMDSSAGDDREPFLEETVVKYLINYCVKIEKKKNSSHIENFHASFSQYIGLLNSEQLQTKFIPRFYLSLKMNLPLSTMVVNTLLQCLVRQFGNSSLVTSYISKIVIELGKSSRSFERETALQFFLNASRHFSMEVFQQFKMAEKIMHFASDKNFRVKMTLLKFIPDCLYYFTKEEKQEYKVMLARMAQTTDDEIKRYIQEQSEHFEEDERVRLQIELRSSCLREQEKLRQINSQTNKRILTRKDLFSIKDMKYLIGKEDTILTKKKPLVTQSNLLPRLKQHRLSVDKPRGSKMSGTSLKVGTKRA